MRLKPKMACLSAVVVAALTLAASQAQAVTVAFSFNSSPDWSNRSGTVTGLIYGLIDDATSAATDVTLTSYPATLGSFPSDDIFAWPSIFVSFNTFTLSGGVVVDATFLLSDPATQALGINFVYNQLRNGSATLANNAGLAGVTFSSVVVPEPASLAVFGFGLVALSSVRRRWRSQFPAS